MSSALPLAAWPGRGFEVFVTVMPDAVAGRVFRRDCRLLTGLLVSRIRPSTVRRAISLGTLCAPRQGEVGTDWP